MAFIFFFYFIWITKELWFCSLQTIYAFNLSIFFHAFMLSSHKTSMTICWVPQYFRKTIFTPYVNRVTIPLHHEICQKSKLTGKSKLKTPTNKLLHYSTYHVSRQDWEPSTTHDVSCHQKFLIFMMHEMEKQNFQRLHVLSVNGSMKGKIENFMAIATAHDVSCNLMLWPTHHVSSKSFHFSPNISYVMRDIFTFYTTH